MTPAGPAGVRSPFGAAASAALPAFPRGSCLETGFPGAAPCSLPPMGEALGVMTVLALRGDGLGAGVLLREGDLAPFAGGQQGPGFWALRTGHGS